MIYYFDSSMNFVETHLKSLDAEALLALADEFITGDPEFLKRAKKIEPDKQSRFDHYKKEIIRERMAEVLDKNFSALTFAKQVSSAKSWDDFIVSCSLVDEQYKLFDSFKTFFTNARECFQKDRASLDLDQLRKFLQDYFEKGIVSSGIRTALVNAFGLLRVIPMLMNTPIVSKSQFKSFVSNQGFAALLMKFAALHSNSMMIFTENLYRSFTGEEQIFALDVESRKNSLQAADLLSKYSGHSKLFNPENFKLAKDTLSLSDIGQGFYDYADSLYKDCEKIGCPIIWIKEAMPTLIEHIAKIIDLIPDSTFTELVSSEFSAAPAVEGLVLKDLRLVQSKSLVSV